MAEILSKFDRWLNTGSDVAALVIREYLSPVEGADGVIFPATFAAQKGAESDKSKFQGGYNIDKFPDDKNVCQLDSVGSQSNRIEPIFALPKYKSLVPQVVIKAGDKEVNLLQAGHRAGDAIVRCSSLQAEIHEAFRAVQGGNAERLARIAPTSLVFGVWDSRGTQAKLPRLIASTIRAFNVRKLTRSAQFVPATEYAEQGLLAETDDNKVKDAYAERGFIHVPASGSHGGVIADGGIRRDATLSLAALRLLSAGRDESKTLSLRRYIFGLSLVALTHPPESYLRQGCNLVLDPAKPREFLEVHVSGERVPSKISHDEALGYATAAAGAFVIGADRTVEFDRALAERDVAGEPSETEAATKKSRKK